MLLLGVVFKAAAQRNHTVRAGKQKNINTLLVCSFVRASTCPSTPSLSYPPSPSILVANFPLSLPFSYVSSVTHPVSLPTPCLCVFRPLLFVTFPASLPSTCVCSLLRCLSSSVSLPYILPLPLYLSRLCSPLSFLGFLPRCSLSSPLCIAFPLNVPCTVSFSPVSS